MKDTVPGASPGIRERLSRMATAAGLELVRIDDDCASIGSDDCSASYIGNHREVQAYLQARIDLRSGRRLESRSTIMMARCPLSLKSMIADRNLDSRKFTAKAEPQAGVFRVERFAVIDHARLFTIYDVRVGTISQMLQSQSIPAHVADPCAEFGIPWQMDPASPGHAISVLFGPRDGLRVSDCIDVDLGRVFFEVALLGRSE